MRVYWNGGGVWDPRVSREQAGTEMRYQVENWYYYNWLCGDHICEQHIHNLDVGNWWKDAYPVKCRGMGGREVRTDKKYELTVVGEDSKVSGDVHVTTNIALTRDGKPEVVEVVYVMHLVGDTYKVQDIVTDGVSLAKNYKFEFNKIIRDKGIDELISRLENKLVELAANKK